MAHSGIQVGTQVGTEVGTEVGGYSTLRQDTQYITIVFHSVLFSQPNRINMWALKGLEPSSSFLNWLIIRIQLKNSNENNTSKYFYYQSTKSLSSDTHPSVY